MKRLKHLLRHAVWPLLGFLLAHLICCYLDYFTEWWDSKMQNEKTASWLHPSLLSGCVAAWLAGYAVRFRPRDSSYFVQPVSYLERLGVQVLVLLVFILGLVVVQWFLSDGGLIEDSWWRLRYAIHHGQWDYRLVVAFFLTGLLGFSWLRALLLVGITYCLGYSCLMTLTFVEVKQYPLILSWGMVLGLGLVAYVAYKRRVDASEFRLSISCAVSVIISAIGLAHTAKMLLERDLDIATNRMFARHSDGVSYTMAIAGKVKSGQLPEDKNSVLLNLRALSHRGGLEGGARQKVSWSWRTGPDQPWMPENFAQFDCYQLSDYYQLNLQNSKSEAISLQGGQIKFQATFAISNYFGREPSESGAEHYNRMVALGFPQGASRTVEFVIDDVTLNVPGLVRVKAAPVSSKKILGPNLGAALILANADRIKSPENVIELVSFVQGHSEDEIAPLVSRWLPELLQLLEKEIRIPVITKAIEKGATETQKAQIIAKVQQIPRLVSVLIAHGWVKDAKQQILACDWGSEFPILDLLHIMIDSGYPDDFPLIHRAIQTGLRRQKDKFEVENLKLKPELLDFIWEQCQKDSDSGETRQVMMFLISSGYRSALVDALGKPSFFLNDHLRDNFLRPIVPTIDRFLEIKSHPERLVFHPQLKVFIFTPPAAP